MTRVGKPRKRSVFSVVLAFSEPPRSFRFALSKSGRVWWRSTPSRAEAIELGLRLKDLGIRGIVKPGKLDQQWMRKTPPRPDAYKVGSVAEPKEEYTYPYPEALKEAIGLRR